MIAFNNDGLILDTNRLNSNGEAINEINIKAFSKAQNLIAYPKPELNISPIIESSLNI